MGDLPLTRAGVLVTGGSSGIGLAVASSFVAHGATVVSAARRPLGASGAHLLEADLSHPDACAETVGRAAEVLGRLDVLVAAAGVMVIDDVLDASVADWDSMASVNLTGTTACVRAALPHLVEAASGPRGCADLVVVGSLSAVRPTPGRAMYAATKAALSAFVDVVRQELAETQVRATLVLPGLTATGLRSTNSAAALARLDESTPSLRAVIPLAASDVADAVVWATRRPPSVSIGELTVLPTTQGW